MDQRPARIELAWRSSDTNRSAEWPPSPVVAHGADSEQTSLSTIAGHLGASHTSVSIVRRALVIRSDACKGGTGTLEEALAWVEYCNGPATRTGPNSGGRTPEEMNRIESKTGLWGTKVSLFCSFTGV